MLISAELRWFWPKETFPAGVRTWFCESGEKPGGGAVREDVYVSAPDDPGNDDPLSGPKLGIKKRGKKPGFEIKGLVSVAPNTTSEPFAGQIQRWCKWTYLGDLNADDVITTHKMRQLRKFDITDGRVSEIPLGDDEKPINGKSLPAEGCNLELTRITVSKSEDEWWTLGFEAFGPLGTVEKNLAQTLAFVSPSGPISMASAEFASYPKWLSDLTAKTGKS
jgi:hypothetical protein